MKRLLVVDDNTEFLQTLSTVLSGDFDTIKAKGVKEALDILQEITVDAVCSDFNMEVKEGDEHTNDGMQRVGSYDIHRNGFGASDLSVFEGA